MTKKLRNPVNAPRKWQTKTDPELGRRRFKTQELPIFGTRLLSELFSPNFLDPDSWVTQSYQFSGPPPLLDWLERSWHYKAMTKCTKVVKLNNKIKLGIKRLWVMTQGSRSLIKLDIKKLLYSIELIFVIFYESHLRRKSIVRRPSILLDEIVFDFSHLEVY